MRTHRHPVPLVITWALVAVVFASTTSSFADPAPSAAEPPTEWRDAESGHRVIRLTHEPGETTLYFNLNGISLDGKKVILISDRRVAMVDIATRVTEQLVRGRAQVLGIGPKSGKLYYVSEGQLFTVDLVTKRRQRLAAVPRRGTAMAVNADESIVAGTLALADAAKDTGERPRNKAAQFIYDYTHHPPMALFFLNLRTGALTTFASGNDWLNHLQFSPTDSTLLLFCHEGPWHEVDRLWTIRADGSQLTKVHTRTMTMEIAGHEFFSADGKTIWYDLQTPRAEDFWLAGLRVDTQERIWYHLQRNDWSVHFNASPDGELFAGDGSDKSMTALAPDASYISLYHPELTPSRTDTTKKASIQPGVLRGEHLVDMRDHDYTLEPNVRFTPDGKWIVFRSNMHGAPHVYAVATAK